MFCEHKETGDLLICYTRFLPPFSSSSANAYRHTKIIEKKKIQNLIDRYYGKCKQTLITDFQLP